MPRRFLFLLYPVCLSLACFAPVQAQGSYREALLNFGLPELTPEVIQQLEARGIPQEGLPETRLQIIHKNDKGQEVTHEFTVELATSPREWSIGLMLRPYMSADRGMLFIMEDGPKSFWMRNTLIPLDIIYITSDGKITSIAQGRPLDSTALPSDGPAMHVLELNVGTAERLGFGPGDAVQWD